MSQRIAAKITGVAAYLPPRLLTNADLEKIVQTTDEWIRERTGIRERHIVDPGVATSHMATEAALLRSFWTRVAGPVWAAGPASEPMMRLRRFLRMRSKALPPAFAAGVADCANGD